MEGNVIYEEDFVDSRVMNNEYSINFTLNRIKEVHSPDAGWVVGEPEITVNPDGKTVTIKVHLAKYEMKQGYSK